MARVRYVVEDVDVAVDFYVSKLGFEIRERFGSVIAILANDDLESYVAELRELGVKFRNDIVEAQGRKQTICEDPAGNVIELFQAP